MLIFDKELKAPPASGHRDPIWHLLCDPTGSHLLGRRYPSASPHLSYPSDDPWGPPGRISSVKLDAPLLESRVRAEGALSSGEGDP